MISTDVQKLSAGSLIDLYEIDATSIGGSVLRWANETNVLGGRYSLAREYLYKTSH